MSLIFYSFTTICTIYGFSIVLKNKGRDRQLRLVLLGLRASNSFNSGGGFLLSERREYTELLPVLVALKSQQSPASVRSSH